MANRQAGRAAELKGRRTAELSHVDDRGHVRMVDVGDKPVSDRVAVARGHISIGETALRAIREGAIAKGDPLAAARLAGIMAAKKTADLIPLCHPLPLSQVDVGLEALPDGYAIEARVRTTARTGVEMEALVAVSTAALTVYDMIKSVDRGVRITDVHLALKDGGKSGRYEAAS